MQAGSLGGKGESSLGALQPGATAPLILASPNSRAKLLLLEKRLTGGDSRTEQPAGANSSMAHATAAGSNSRAADEAAAEMDEDVQLCAEIHPAQQQQLSAQQQTPPGSSATTAPASKRRKTGNPKHRPASSEPQHDSSRGPHATPGTKGDSAAPAAARDKTPNRARASPNRAGGGAESGPGGSNPPMSPVAGISGGHGLQRTPRSHSKQQAAHSRGQTNISKFFPLVMEGSSRDSDTPAHALQQQQQHVQQRRPQQQQQQPRLIPVLTPIEEIFIDAAHPSQQHDQQQQQQQPQQLPQQLLGRQRSGSCERNVPAAGAGAAATAATNAAHGAAVGAAAASAAPSGKAQRGGRSSKGSSGSGSGSNGSGAALQQQQQQQQLLELQAKHQQELEQVQQLARQEELRLQGALSSSQQQVEQMSATILQLQQELAASRSSSDSRQAEVRSAVTYLATQLAVSNGRLSRLQLSLDGTRLGCLGFSRTGPLGFTEVWEDGPVLRELSVRLAVLARAREEVETARKVLRKKLPPPPKATAAAAAAAAAAAVAADASSCASAPDGGNSNDSQYLSQADFVMQDELLKVRLSVLKREEELLLREEERLQQEKMRHIRSLKRVRDEDSSRFNGQPTLNGRYVLLQLLGRGGFSEVHKAYDLETLGFVAVKIHQLNSTWSEARKASYVRHAVREYTIHKALHHRNIVSLTDIFEVDNTTFATVLELCEGGDLEGHLQQFHTLPEREARAIIAQVFAGLAHLNRADGQAADASGPRVIHYDLKPANILFDSLGTVKITDFGLSKVVEEGQTMGMELTSQGAGTYWYLPPECFATAAHSSSIGSAAASRRSPAPGGAGHGLLPAGLLGGGAAAGAAAAAAAGGVGAGVAPLISNKVDVWSAGVILFQMLYGRRPFGEGLTQEQIYRDGVMLNARQVQFPAKPVVSAEGKAFISRCLAYNQEERWDVLTAAADAYLQLKR